MNCELQSLYFGDDGYIVRCKNCGHYQLAYLCICIVIEQEEFKTFCETVLTKYEESHPSCAEHTKCVLIPTPATNVSFLLTKAEAKRLIEILEEADNEIKAQSLMSLFN